MLERLAQLDAAAAAAHTGTLTPEARTEAESTAHKLSGSLGMFGFQTGTECARALEAELQTAAPQPAMLAALAVRLREAVGLTEQDEVV